LQTAQESRDYAGRDRDSAGFLMARSRACSGDASSATCPEGGARCCNCCTVCQTLLLSDGRLSGRATNHPTLTYLNPRGRARQARHCWRARWRARRACPSSPSPRPSSWSCTWAWAPAACASCSRRRARSRQPSCSSTRWMPWLKVPPAPRPPGALHGSRKAMRSLMGGRRGALRVRPCPSQQASPSLAIRRRRLPHGSEVDETDVASTVPGIALVAARVGPPRQQQCGDWPR